MEAIIYTDFMSIAMISAYLLIVFAFIFPRELSTCVYYYVLM